MNLPTNEHRLTPSLQNMSQFFFFFGFCFYNFYFIRKYFVYLNWFYSSGTNATNEGDIHLWPTFHFRRTGDEAGRFWRRSLWFRCWFWGRCWRWFIFNHDLRERKGKGKRIEKKMKACFTHGINTIIVTIKGLVT